jgi:hypothetical protein
MDRNAWMVLIAQHHLERVIDKRNDANRHGSLLAGCDVS